MFCGFGGGVGGGGAGGCTRGGAGRFLRGGAAGGALGACSGGSTGSGLAPLGRGWEEIQHRRLFQQGRMSSTPQTN